MRLLQIVPGTSLGGAERYAVTIAEAAVAEGWEVHTALSDTAEDHELARAFDGIGARPRALASEGSGLPAWEAATAIRRTIRLLGDVRPDVVHVVLPFPTFARGALIACTMRRLPTVVVFQLTPDQFDVGRSQSLYAALRARQVWVAVSDSGRDAIIRSFGASPREVGVIRNGVKPAAGEMASAEERAAVRRDLRLPESAFLALSVGRLSRQKAHGDLIPAAAEAATRWPHVHFVIVGEGEEREALESLIGARGLERTVRLVGQRQDVGQLLRAADLFVFPSHFEGFPFALLEAAAHRLPLVSADFSGAREVIDDEAGLLYPPGDTVSLWRCLESAVEANPDELRAMGERARNAAARFSREAMVSATLRALAGAAGRGRARSRRPRSLRQHD
ncbi:MAG: glycosyltransferase [Thermoleophilaceae bacterium]